jgi:hypothetical protein
MMVSEVEKHFEKVGRMAGRVAERTRLLEERSEDANTKI